MMILLWIFGAMAMVTAVPSRRKEASQGYKDQYCTDPRTMKKHGAYTEWADAYSCTRHRCQPGGRNLAIYTVGCKRVEAPESAIECEEVVEDTNMQFPFCCTRLRCLVVVRGEVWTRVLGQPWEVLPAAPWSHMYKMKKPPPSDVTFQPKGDEGPVYELTELESEGQNAREKIQRSGNKLAPITNADCNNAVSRTSLSQFPAPDIVIALSTNNEKGQDKHSDSPRFKHAKKILPESRKSIFQKEDDRDHHENELQDIEDLSPSTEKSSYYQVSWTEIPQTQSNEHDGMDAEIKPNEPSYRREIQFQVEEKSDKKEKMEKPGHLQALVDAIGTRMKDIESVVQRMSDKVHQSKNQEIANKNTFLIKNYDSKYVHIDDATLPTNIEDNGNYFSDASNALRRASYSQLQEPDQSPLTYMAPVETNHKIIHIAMGSAKSEDSNSKKNKHSHKKKKIKSHKKHYNQDKRKHNKLSSLETNMNIVSLEDSGVLND